MRVRARRNAIVLWTTKYIDAAVEALRVEGHEIHDEDIARLSTLKLRNLNRLGRYSFTASVPAGGALRPLRDPGAHELDEDDGGPDRAFSAAGDRRILPLRADRHHACTVTPLLPPGAVCCAAPRARLRSRSGGILPRRGPPG